MGAQPIGVEALGVAFLLVSVVIAISRGLGLGLERQLLVGAARTLVQLSLVGYLLGWVFQASVWYWTPLLLGGMLAAGVHTAGSRTAHSVPGSLGRLALAMGVGSLLVLLIVIFAILQPDPWFSARETVPIFGMILGNSMIAASLAMERYGADLKARRGEVEAALSLGLPVRQAAASIFRGAIQAALTPSISSMMVVGVVQLPGMMTGQLLAGADPTQAVRYQIVVMYMTTSAAGITAALTVLLCERGCFTRAHQFAVE